MAGPGFAPGTVITFKNIRRVPWAPWTSNLERTELLISEIKQELYFRVQKSKPITAYEGKGHFNFLGLPRELRDDVYSYALSNNTIENFGGYDSVVTQAKHHFRPDVRRSPRRRSEQVSPSLAIFHVNTQLHSEAMDAVYRENTFVVTVDPVSPVFEVRESKRNFDEKKAIPFGWDLSKIVKMCLRIDLGADYDAVTEPLTFNWDGLSKMRCLRELRLVVTAWGGRWNYDEDWIGPPEEEGLRKLIRDLVLTIPKGVEAEQFGIGETDERLQVWEWFDLWEVPGYVLRDLFNDLRKLKGDSGTGNAIQP